MQRVAARIDTLASETMLRATIVEMRQALAHLEDAVQRPLLGDFEVLPDVAAMRSTRISNDAKATKP
jgi:hypothetical protein